MKTKIATYDSHEKALNAVKKLERHKIPLDHVSILGKADIVEDNLHIRSTKTVKDSPLYIGMGAGVLTGLLTGIGVFTIPGFGFLYGAGAIIGAIGGFDLGIIAGGIGSVLMNLGFPEDEAVKYKEHLKKGKFLVLLSDGMEEIEKAEHILHTEGAHLMLD